MDLFKKIVDEAETIAGDAKRGDVGALKDDVQRVQTEVSAVSEALSNTAPGQAPAQDTSATPQAAAQDTPAAQPQAAAQPDNTAGKVGGLLGSLTDTGQDIGTAAPQPAGQADNSAGQAETKP